MFKDSGLTLGQRLYTTAGSHGMLLGSAMSTDISIGDLTEDTSLLSLCQNPTDSDAQSVINIRHMTPVGYLDSCPLLSLSRFGSRLYIHTLFRYTYVSNIT